MADWNMNQYSWIERLVFNVFKFEEPGTIKILVSDSISHPHRVMVTTQPWSVEGWKTRLEFYAYDRARPGTNMIWIGYHAGPDRCIFVKGDEADTIPGWSCQFKFWVPK